MFLAMDNGPDLFPEIAVNFCLVCAGFEMRRTSESGIECALSDVSPSHRRRSRIFEGWFCGVWGFVLFFVCFWVFVLFVCASLTVPRSIQ